MNGTIPTILSLAFIGGLTDAVICDLQGFRIPNRAPLLLVISFLPTAALNGFSLAEWSEHVGVGLALLALGVVLFAFRVWGGGDAKLAPAVGLWIGLAGLPRFLTVMTLVGGVLALLAMMARRIPLAPSGVIREWGDRLAQNGAVPYGLAIAAGGLDWWCGIALLPVGQ